jgi:hypothetical protein
MSHHIIAQLAAIRRGDVLREAGHRRLAAQRPPEERRSPRARARRWLAGHGRNASLSVNRVRENVNLRREPGLNRVLPL